jgi:steroid 5-alpha reductase family enzyme
LDATHLYAYAAATVAVAVISLWVVSVAIKDASIVDVFWGPLFVAIAWVLFALGLDTGAVGAKQLIVLLLVTTWGLRLAFHLGARNFGRGEDSRYQLWRAHGGAFWWLTSLYRVYLLQGAIALVVATPIIAAFSVAEPPFALNWVGVIVWALGFGVEATADVQLIRFKARPDSAGEVMQTGLWASSRHPNYFGDALQWWGLGLFTFTAATWWSLIGPLAMTLVFLGLSNNVIERGLLKRRPGYAQYVARTNAFFPRLRSAVADDTSM